MVQYCGRWVEPGGRPSEWISPNTQLALLNKAAVNNRTSEITRTSNPVFSYTVLCIHFCPLAQRELGLRDVLTAKETVGVALVFTPRRGSLSFNLAASPASTPRLIRPNSKALVIQYDKANYLYSFSNLYFTTSLHPPRQHSSLRLYQWSTTPGKEATATTPRTCGISEQTGLDGIDRTIPRHSSTRPSGDFVATFTT